MRRPMMSVMVWVLAFVMVWGMALAVKAAQEDSFSAAVDLNRFRRGNGEWDTQELVASGMTALHQENLQILRELQEIKSKIARSEAK